MIAHARSVACWKETSSAGLPGLPSHPIPQRAATSTGNCARFTFTGARGWSRSLECRTTGWPGRPGCSPHSTTFLST
ncbi:hypothetical protein HY251_02970 [bacterium]|nr:hypothetical protein [bacterium]